jgi:hypothetical protein
LINPRIKANYSEPIDCEIASSKRLATSCQSIFYAAKPSFILYVNSSISNFGFFDFESANTFSISLIVSLFESENNSF